ncbi:hypothetical protein [Rhodococcus opacus]|uniref:Holliday junction resolvase n=1 Tax=Rhodococcus opacus (strain B4) TaxID=632772 RepID=C1B9C1_RHOOB|nr:hypothetical protein [Rhodococcus opacus]BAH52274.1 hypothetical protein ROP_40270 [Rhodococcus opacus B4]
MARNRASAKAAGSRFERLIADGLALALGDDRIDRRVKTGAKDRGDIAGVRIHGQRLVIECKDCATTSLPQWTREAQLEAGNDDALAGVVVAKRRGTTDPLDQWVHMTVRDLVALITGQTQER